MQRGLVTLLAVVAVSRAAAADGDGATQAAGAATPAGTATGTATGTAAGTATGVGTATAAGADDATEQAEDDVADVALPPTAPTSGPRSPSPRDATLGAIFRGPFRSSRLFAMPAADVVGAYVLSLSGDASLLQEPGILTSAGVIALGFGDIAQLEYRHTEAIGVTGLDAPVPAVGVQLKLPLPQRSGIPAIGIAFRLGVPRSEQVGGQTVDETVTDLYIVGRLRFAQLPWLTLHGGTRISSVKAEPADDALGQQRTMWLPTAGYEVQMNPAAKIVGEIALAPQFQWTGQGATPVIGHGVLGRLGMRWHVLPAIVLDGSLGYQVDDAAPTEGFDAVVRWDIRLGAEVFVPWGALACRATGVFCN